jgi:hypothetical protein
MAVPILQGSRFLRALVLTAWVSSFLVWLYIVLRVIVSGVDVHYPFVDSVPFVSISAMGGFSFFVFIVSMFLYLWLWAPLRGMTMAPPNLPPRP